MNKPIQKSAKGRLKDLILLRLVPDRKNTVTPSRLEQQFRTLFAEPVAMALAPWRETVAASIGELESDGLLETRPLRLTENGRASANRSFGIQPATPNMRWATLRNRYGITKALGITPGSQKEWKRISSADGVRAATVTHYYNLPIGPVPTVAQALNALAWTQLEGAHRRKVPIGKPFSRDAVLRETLLEGCTVSNVIAALAARAVGASSSSADGLRNAVLSNWIHDTSEPPAASRVPQAQAFDLEEFAQEVEALARQASSGRFGDHKVFISHVWDRFRDQSASHTMTRQEFDRHLVEANRKNLLALTRADLISDMAPEDVRQSEICLTNASFHFIRTDTQAV